MEQSEQGRSRTERVEEALRQSEQRYWCEAARLQAVLDAAPAIIWTAWDAECRHISGNRAAYEFSRVPLGEDLSKTGPQPERLRHYRVSRDGVELSPEEMPIQVVARSGSPLTGDAIEFEFDDGSVRSVLGNVVPVLDEKGDPSGAVAAFVDITERRGAERALRAKEAELELILNRTHFMLTRCSRDLRYRYVSRAYAEMIGRTPDQVAGRLIGDIMGEKGLQTILPYVEAALRGQRVEYEETVHFAGVGERRLQVVYTPDLDEDQRVIGWIASILDLTERREAEESLRVANAQLREADRRKDEFLALLSHELRNPLAPITNSLYVLDRAVPGGEEARNSQMIIDRQVRQLTRIVDDLLDVTRIARNKIRLQRDRVELNDLVRRTIEDHRALFDRKGVTLEFEPAPASVPVDGDWNRLGQCLGNLLQNAVKFTGPGGRVRVSVSSDPAANQALLRVADTGIGMAPEVLSHLFEPFMQAATTLDRSGGGLGLGLALVRGIVELHGGEVSAHSAGPQQGTEFVIRLPLGPVKPAPAEERPAARPPSPRRVLIVEDNVDIAASLCSLLQYCGHEVAVAHEGPEGIAKAREFRPEALLCDIGLPGMSGYEVAQAFRADEALRDTFLVALSGYALPEDLQRAADAGFDQHMAKPPDADKLQELLSELRRRRRM